MFINTAIFKKLVKQAYKGGRLTIGNDGAGTFIEGGYWILKVKNGHLPKKEKAALVELAGELPEAGEVFKVVEKMGNQMEIERKDAWEVERLIESAMEEVSPTMLLVMEKATLCRIMQTKTMKTFTFNEMLYQAVDNTCIDHESESPAEGPYLRQENGEMLFWKNENCIYAACGRFTENGKEKEILAYLENIILTEEEA